MSPTLRSSGVGPLIVLTDSSPPSNEQARTPRAARCKTMPRIESLRSFQGRRAQEGIDQTLPFRDVSSVNSCSQRHFKSVSSFKSQRPKRCSSITREATDMPSRIHRTPSTEMLEGFQTLKVQGSKILDPRLFDHRPSLCLTVTQDVEIYDTEYERPLVAARIS